MGVASGDAAATPAESSPAPRRAAARRVRIGILL
jgi:hypothetical protein